MKYIIFNFIICSIICCFTKNIPTTINITDELRGTQGIVPVCTELNRYAGKTCKTKYQFSLPFLDYHLLELNCAAHRELFLFAPS